MGHILYQILRIILSISSKKHGLKNVNLSVRIYVSILRIAYLLHCRYFSNQRTDLMNSVNSVVQNFDFIFENNKKDLLLFGDPRFDKNKNKVILEATLTFIKKIYWICI